jgi:pimeloyl-ACP methyl ester carboxylesterase
VEVAYDEAGPADGDPVLLLHGFPCDIHSYVDVVPLLADAGLLVIVPYLRGARADVVLGPVQPTLRPAGGAGRRGHRVHGRPWPTKAVLAGYDSGGRAACVAAALWPQRTAAITFPRKPPMGSPARSWN